MNYIVETFDKLLRCSLNLMNIVHSSNVKKKKSIIKTLNILSHLKKIENEYLIEIMKVDR